METMEHEQPSLEALLHESLTRSDFKTALSHLTMMELLFSEDEAYFAENQCGLSPHSFYTVFLIVHLLVEDLNGAKYLWKRAPKAMKDSTVNPNFSNVWAIGKCLWREQMLEAYATLTSTNWGDDIESTLEGHLIKRWRHILQLRQIRAISSTYSVVRLDFLMEQLFFTSQEEAMEAVNQLQWRYDPATSLVYPVAFVQQKSVGEKVSNQLQENALLIEQASKYVSFFEQKTLKAEASKDSGDSSKKGSKMK
jgi:hypothetical protein